MTSMLCQKLPGGQVRVHDSGLVEDLVVDKDDNITTMMVTKQRGSRQQSGLRPSTSPCATRNMDSNCLIGQTMKVQDWLNEKTVKTLQIMVPYSITNEAEEKSDLETKAARRLYSPLLETENTFVRDVEDFLSTKELVNLRKKEVLHKKWNERVYKPLRKKIIEAMDSNDWHEVDRRKRELHKQYLEFTNQKGHVFLDTMDPEEYYAMAMNGHRPAPIKVETRPLQDPLISQGRERNEEERTILRCLTGYRYSDRDIEQIKLPNMPLVPLGRHGTDSIRWLEMPLSNIESTPRLASRKRMIGLFNKTQINFDEWTRTRLSHQEIDKELQIQKKRQYPEDQKPPLPKPLTRKAGLRPLQKIVTFVEPQYPYDIDDPIVMKTLDQNRQLQVPVDVGVE